MSEHTEYIRTVSKILFAYTEGKTIQCLNKGEWEDVKEDKLYTLLKGIDSELPFSQVRVKPKRYIVLFKMAMKW